MGVLVGDLVLDLETGEDGVEVLIGKAGEASIEDKTENTTIRERKESSR